MKKGIWSLLICSLCSILPLRAIEFPGFEWSVGADFTSAYLWRGLRYGGLTVQPDVSIGYGGLVLEGWANIGAEDNTFKAFAPEVDVTLSYSIVGVRVGVNHLYYFDGSKYFDFKGSDYAAYQSEENSTTQTEVFAEFHLGDIVESVPLSIGWYTYIAGDDKYAQQVGEQDGEPIYEMKRAYSSYIEVAYDVNLPLGFTLTPTIGMTPWKSLYTDYEGNFAFNNLSLKLNWEFEVGDHFALDVYALGSLNTYNVNKDNLIPRAAESYGVQRLNGAIGLGLWFY